MGTKWIFIPPQGQCDEEMAEDGDADYQEGNNAVKEAPYDELSHFTPSLSILPLPPGEG